MWANLFWEFPGGRLQSGESPEHAVVREFQEETEWQVENLVAIGAVKHTYMHYRVTLYGFFCDLAAGNADKPVLHAAQEWRWVSLVNLPFRPDIAS
ncbi:MAG: NUDIX domain-containing protein [Desulfobulbaceae bacterium]|nr:NUDIX domain-containing protein [Desulfobulbaceae bacterium]